MRDAEALIASKPRHRAFKNLSFPLYGQGFIG